MRLALSHYLRTLRERDEFDRLLPELLTELGYVPLVKPKAGVRQFGVDFPAAGRSPVDGVEELLLFVIKQGDIGRRTWDGDQNAVRQSMDEIVDVWLASHVPPEYQNHRKVTLWQLAARTLQMPFEARFSGDIDGYQMRLYREALARRIRKVETPFFEVIRRCLDPEPSMRYASFPALREDIKAALKRDGLRAMDFIVKPGLTLPLDSVSHGWTTRWLAGVGRRASFLRTALG